MTEVFKIPRVKIHIPGQTSREVCSPAYEFPILARVFRDHIADPGGDPLRIVPHPKNATYESYWFEVEADDIDEVVAIESDRLRAFYGMELEAKDTYFDTVYPAGLFKEQVVKAIESGKNLKDDEARRDPIDEIATLAGIINLDRVACKRLVSIGWRSAEDLVSADVDQLSKIIGKVKAVQIMRAAEEHLNILINASPDVQIEAAKKAAKK